MRRGVDLSVSRLVRRAEGKMESGRTQSAEALFARALALIPPSVDASAAPEAQRLRGHRFKLLANLGRYSEAFRLGDRALKAGASMAELRHFRYPWSPAALRAGRARHIAQLEQSAPSRWRTYYLGILKEQASADPPRFSGRRYAWMHWEFAMACLRRLELGKAERLFRRIVRDQKPYLWMAQCHLAEVYLCQGLRRRALEGMDAAVAGAPAEERGEALGWRGELKLWLGDYKAALVDLEDSCRLGSPLAFCWRGAAKLLLGEPSRALADLDRALALAPGDAEALVWRAEALRSLGRFKACLACLEGRPPETWTVVNRALARKALRDYSGMRKDFAYIPPGVKSFIESATGLRCGSRPSPGRIEELLLAGLKLAKGYRRHDDYGGAVWMRRPLDKSYRRGYNRGELGIGGGAMVKKAAACAAILGAIGASAAFAKPPEFSCREGLSPEKMASDKNLSSWDKSGPVPYFVNRYFLCRAVASADRAACSPLKSVAAQRASDRKLLPTSLFSCRDFSGRALLSKALISHDPSFKKLCGKIGISSGEEHFSAADNETLCSIFQDHEKDPAKGGDMAMAVHMKYRGHLPGEPPSPCTEQIKDFWGLGKGCYESSYKAGVFDADSCLVSQASVDYRKALAAKDPQACGGDLLCRAMMGDAGACEGYARQADEAQKLLCSSAPSSDAPGR